MTQSSIVRKALPEDKGQMMHLLELMHDENGLFELDKGKVEWMLDRILYPDSIESNDNGHRGLAGVIGNGHLEGIIILVLGRTWYSSDVCLEDAANFVHPDHRRSDHAKALIGYAKNLTDVIRQDHPSFKMILGVVSTKRTAAKVRLYERQLSAPIGAFFAYPPPVDSNLLTNTFRT